MIGGNVKNAWMLALIIGGATTVLMAQTSPAPQSSHGAATASEATKPQAETANPPQRPQGPAIPATLAKSVDSKKVKAGDPIEAKTDVSMSNASGVQIPQGSKIVGRITEVKSRSKGDAELSLTFSFDKIVLKNGQELPFHAIAQAIGLPQSSAQAAFPENGGPASQPGQGGGGQSGMRAPGATPNTAGADNSGAAQAQPGTAGSGNTGMLPENATGAVNLKGLTLTSQNNESVVTSSSKSVKLDSGTQMLVRVLPQ